MKTRSTRATGIAALLTISAAVSGCATIGANFDSTSLDWIEPGETTKSQVLERLGNPFRVGVDAGDQTWTYGYYRYKVFGTSTTKDLVVRWDRSGRVKSYTLNTSFPEEKKALEPALRR